MIAVRCAPVCLAMVLALPFSWAADFVLLGDDQAARALVPSAANGGDVMGDAWTFRTFDDSGWAGGRTGVGYDDDPGTGGDYRSLVRFDVSAMRGHNASVFIRIPFTLDAVTRPQLRRLTLQLRYDDGFVAWLNGVRVAAANAPEPLAWNSGTHAAATHDARPEAEPESFDLTAQLSRLQDGTNWLAIQALNATSGDNDLLLAPRLVASDSPPPTWPSPRLVEVAGVGPLDYPVAVRSAFDGSGRLFIVERAGRIKAWQNGELSTFLDITDRVLTSDAASDERGLLGVAFPPGFGVLFRHFYVYYTTRHSPQPGDQRLARFFLADGPANVAAADPTSERTVLQLEDPAGNHNGGDLHFGPDGYLYVGLGDGGGANDPERRAQSPEDLWGKMLRIDTEAGAPETSTYAVPIDNPFVGVAGVRPEIWHLGLRNPWRWSFDRDTGEMWIGDVGQEAWEEISFAPPLTSALNFGWPRFEGSRLRPGEPTLSTDPDATRVTLGWLTPPIAETSHTDGERSVIGGYVYRGPEFPRLQGVYIYADHYSGRIHGIQPDGAVWRHATLRETSSLRLSSFGEAEDGALFATSLESDGPGTGRLYKIIDGTDTEWLQIHDLAFDADTGRASFRFGAIIGKFYQPETSVDLSSWSPLGPVLQATTTPVPFADPDPPAHSSSPRYFRIREL